MPAIKGTEINNNIIVELNDKSFSFPAALKTVTGSRLYGTQYEKGENPIDPDYVSDYDYRGLFILAPSFPLSLIHKEFDTIQIVGGEDEEFYELKKFTTLALENNPNIMDILFADDDSILHCSPEIKNLLDHKKDFLSLKAKDSFSGYAMSQLVRMKNHKKYVVEYPEINKVENLLQDSVNKGDIDFLFISEHFNGKLAAKITGETANKNTVIKNPITLKQLIQIYNVDYDLYKYTKPHISQFMNFYDNTMSKISKDMRDSIKNKLENEGSYQSITPSLMRLTLEGNGIFHRAGTLIKKTKKPNGEFLCLASVDNTNFASHIKNIDDLWEWRLGRNPKRAILEDMYGYDTKHAMHLVRLLMGAEDLITKGDYSPRIRGKNLNIIKDIREGRINYNDMLKLAEFKFQNLNSLVKSSECKLPQLPNRELINEIMLDIYSKCKFNINDFLLSKKTTNTNNIGYKMK